MSTLRARVPRSHGAGSTYIICFWLVLKYPSCANFQRAPTCVSWIYSIFMPVNNANSKYRKDCARHDIEWHKICASLWSLCGPIYDLIHVPECSIYANVQLHLYTQTVDTWQFNATQLRIMRSHFDDRMRWPYSVIRIAYIYEYTICLSAWWHFSALLYGQPLNALNCNQSNTCVCERCWLSWNKSSCFTHTCWLCAKRIDLFQ